PLLGAGINGDAGDRPPTPAMKRFADSVARQTGIKPPAGYTKSRSICRTFLDRHAPKKAGSEPPGETGCKPPSPAKMTVAEKIAREKGIVIPDETMASSAAVSAWIASNLGTEHGKGRGKTAYANELPRSIRPKRRPRKRTIPLPQLHRPP